MKLTYIKITEIKQNLLIEYNVESCEMKMKKEKWYVDQNIEKREVTGRREEN